MGIGSKGNRRRESRREKLTESGRKIGKVSRTLITIIAIAVTAGGLPLLGYFGYRQVLDSGYFSPQVTVIDGNARVSDDEILDAAKLDADGVNLIELDTDEVEEAVEALVWVDSATVETELPDTVHITVSEREPMGLVLADQLYVVDDNGEVVKIWTPDEPIDDAIVSGIDLDDPKAASHVKQGFEIMSLYQTMGLQRWAQLAEVHWDNRLGVSLFAGDTEIRLGHDRFDERLRRLSQVFALLEKRGYSAEYVLLDMEEDLDRVAIKPYPKVVSAPPPPQEQDEMDGDEVSEPQAN